MVYQLTQKDRKILYALSLDGRASISTIAKKVRLSKQVVSYRLKLLEERKVILGSYAIIDPYRLGRTYYRLFFKYQMNEQIEKDFRKYAEANPNITWLAYFDGDLDIALTFCPRNIREFELEYKELSKRFGNYFLHVDFSIGTRIDYFKYNYLLGKQATIGQPTIVLGDCFEDQPVDDLDKSIMSALSINARTPLIELAQQFKSSAKIIKSRIDSLVRRRVILGYTVKINHVLIGYTHQKIFLKLSDISENTIASITSYIQLLKAAIYITHTIGRDTIEFEIMTQSYNEYHEITRTIRSRFSRQIASVRSVIHYFEPRSGQMVWV